MNDKTFYLFCFLVLEASDYLYNCCYNYLCIQLLDKIISCSVFRLKSSYYEVQKMLDSNNTIFKQQ